MNIWRAKRAENFGVTVEENMKKVVFSGQYVLLRAKSRNLLLRLVVIWLITFFVLLIKAPRRKWSFPDSRGHDPCTAPSPGATRPQFCV